MQCHARRLLVKMTFEGKVAEKKALFSIQRNIRLYLTCRDWSWYKYYTMVKGESEKLKMTFEGKVAEKKALFSIQRNIRLYLTCRDWSWYKYSTMVKGESEKLKKKMAEEERK